MKRLDALRQKTAQRGRAHRPPRAGEVGHRGQDPRGRAPPHRGRATEAAQAERADAAFAAARAAEAGAAASPSTPTRAAPTRPPSTPTTSMSRRGGRPHRARRARARGGRIVAEATRRWRAHSEHAARVRIADKQLAAARAVQAVRKLREAWSPSTARRTRWRRGGRAARRARGGGAQLKRSTEAAASEMRRAPPAPSGAARCSSSARRRRSPSSPRAATRTRSSGRDEDARQAREAKRIEATLAANMTALQGRLIRDYQTEALERDAHASVAAVEEKAKSISRRVRRPPTRSSC